MKKTTQQKQEAILNAIYKSIVEDESATKEQKREANKTQLFYNWSRMSYEEALFRLLLANSNKVRTIYSAKVLATLSQLETITQENK